LWLTPMRGGLSVHDDCHMSVSILIVDDHEAFRLSARNLLEADGLVVVGLAPDGRSALELARSLRPDIVLLDVQLPDIDGFVVAEQLAALDKAPAVVLISSRDAAAYGTRLAASSARGFVAKRDLAANVLLRLAS
jgi:DNA-binding NarL/FixJ family response regulator